MAFSGPRWCTVPSWMGVGAAEVLNICRQHDVEGAVAKRLSSRYWPARRRSEWVKIKTTEWRTLHSGRRQEYPSRTSSAR